MRQLKWLSLLGLLLWGPSTYAQSVRYQSQAISSRGAGIANATIAVCTQPANTNTQPCSPLATLATSTSTTSGGANPLTADSFGNFFFYAAPGRYTVQIYGPAVFGQLVTPDVVVPCDPAGACTIPYLPKSIVADFGAKCDGRIVTDWTQSSGNTTATSATANFTAADVGKIVGINNGTSGAPNALLSTTIATFVNSTTVTTTVAPNRTITPVAGGGDGWAALGTNDDAAFAAAVSSGGGRWVVLPANQVCTIKSTIYVQSISDFTLSGFGSKSNIVFLPVAPLSTGVNASVIFVQSNFTARRQIANAIAIGATSFTLSNAGDGSDLVANDWLAIGEGDPNAAGPGSSEKVNFDYVQVQSVAGTTVNVKSPFRTVFTTSRTFNVNNQNGLGFYRVIPAQTDNGIKLLNFRITAPIGAAATLNETGIYVFTARNVEVGGVYINAPKPIATYDTKGLDFHDIFIEGIPRVTPEVASTVDSKFTNWTYLNAGTALDSTTQPQIAGLSVDFGSAFNQFSSITVDATGNTGIACTVAHDNVFNGINIGYVRNAGSTPQGFLFTGCYNNKIENVVLSGADTTGVPFNFGNTSGFGTNVNDANNIIGSAFVGTSWNQLSTLTAANDTIWQPIEPNSPTGGVRLTRGNRFTNTMPASSFFLDTADTSSDVRISSAGVCRYVMDNFNLFPCAVGLDLGKTTLPFQNFWFGTAATNGFKLQPGATTGARIITVTDPVSPTTVGLPLTIASGTSTLTSNATLGAGTCQAVVTTAATGVATTDSIEWSFATNPATGDAISPVASSVTSGNVNFTRCNPTAAAQNVTAIVINWRVVR